MRESEPARLARQRERELERERERESLRQKEAGGGQAEQHACRDAGFAASPSRARSPSRACEARLSSSSSPSKLRVSLGGKGGGGAREGPGGGGGGGGGGIKVFLPSELGTGEPAAPNGGPGAGNGAGADGMHASAGARVQAGTELSGVSHGGGLGGGLLGLVGGAGHGEDLSARASQVSACALLARSRMGVCACLASAGKHVTSVSALRSIPTLAPVSLTLSPPPSL